MYGKDANWGRIVAAVGRSGAAFRPQDVRIALCGVELFRAGQPLSDNFDERIEQKIFHCEIVVDNARVSAETKAYQKIPEIVSFTDENGNDTMHEDIERNYKQIKADVENIVKSEMTRIKNDENLQHLVKEK